MSYLDFLKSFKKKRKITDKQKSSLFLQQAISNGYLIQNQKNGILTQKGKQFVNKHSPNMFKELILFFKKHG